jgi:hypothetical protein
MLTQNVPACHVRLTVKLVLEVLDQLKQDVSLAGH